MTTASGWSCGGDLMVQAGTPTNGGAAVDAGGFPPASSSHLAVAEECTNPPPNSPCGRGEFGYGGGELPASAVALNSDDPAANGESFACPSSAAGSGSGAVAGGTQTGTAGGTPPEVLFFPGNLQGGNQGLGANFTGDTQCYSPYVAGSSQATGGPAQGNVYEAAVAPITGGRNATWFVPNTSASGTNCNGQVLQAGGNTGTTSSRAADLYNPNANSANFNTWSSIPRPPSGYQASMVAARDTPAAVQLDSVPNAPAGDTQLLLIGGESLVTAGQYSVLNSYEIFDANKCGFLSAPTSSPMSSVRYDFGAAKFASGDVLVCGGAADQAFDFSNTCDLFVPNFNVSGGGTWYGSVAAMSRVRAGNFAALIPASIVTSQATPSSSILMAGGSSSGGPAGTFAPDPTSDICTENTQSTVNGHFAVSCSLDSASYDSNSSDLGLTPQTAIGAEDASHVTIGCNPAEGYVGPGSPYTSYQCNGIAKLAGEVSDNTDDGLLLACGGFAGHANAFGGNDTQIECEYYVPSGRKVPNGLSCNPSGATSGPAWCVKRGLHMNRERAYFSLTEVVPGQSGSATSVPDSFWALGGFYGLADTTGLQHLVRKNVEWLVKAVPTGASGLCGNPNTATAATTTYPRQDHISQGACVRVKGYIADTCIQNDQPCKSLSCALNIPNPPCRYRAEATAQSKAIRQLAATRGDTTYSRVQWEYGPGPDAVYSPDVSQPNCDPCEAPPSSNSSRPLWRIDIVADDAYAFEVKRWDGWGCGSGTTCKVQTQVQSQLNTYVQNARSLSPSVQLGRGTELAGWIYPYTDDQGRAWCVWGDPDTNYPGQVYFAPVAVVPSNIQQLNPQCASSVSPPFRATSHSPFPQDMHSQFSNEAQSAIVEYLVDKLLQAYRTYRIDFISPDGVDEQVYQGPADASGSIDATVTTPVWMGHGDWGTLLVDDAATGQTVSFVYVTSDC